MTLATQILTTAGALLVILGDLLAGRKTEDQARAECLAKGYLIPAGDLAEELAAHEKGSPR